MTIAILKKTDEKFNWCVVRAARYWQKGCAMNALTTCMPALW